MPLEMLHVTVDSTHPAAQAAFWAAALGWSVAPDAGPDSARVGGPHRPADAPGWLFVAVPEGRTVKNRLHVDLAVTGDDDLESEVGRLEGLGATRGPQHSEQDGARWVVMHDPEGNELCVVEVPVG